MNAKQYMEIKKEINDLTDLFKSLCDDVDMIRETMAAKILDASPEPEKRTQAVRTREVDDLEKMFANVSRTKKMKKDDK